MCVGAIRLSTQLIIDRTQINMTLHVCLKTFSRCSTDWFLCTSGVVGFVPPPFADVLPPTPLAEESEGRREDPSDRRQRWPQRTGAKPEEEKEVKKEEQRDVIRRDGVRRNPPWDKLSNRLCLLRRTPASQPMLPEWEVLCLKNAEVRAAGRFFRIHRLK